MKKTGIYFWKADSQFTRLLLLLLLFQVEWKAFFVGRSKKLNFIRFYISTIVANFFLNDFYTDNNNKRNNDSAIMIPRFRKIWLIKTTLSKCFQREAHSVKYIDNEQIFTEIIIIIMLCLRNIFYPQNLRLKRNCFMFWAGVGQQFVLCK